MKVFYRYWPSMITLAVVLYATLWSDPVGDYTLPPIPHLDKLIHAVMMGGLYGAVLFDKQRADHRPPSAAFMRVTACIVMVFCIFDEIAQSLMGIGRSGDILDLAADWFGIIVAYFIAPPAIKKGLKR